MSNTFPRVISQALITALSIASAAAAVNLTPVDCADGTIIVQDRPGAGLFEGAGLGPAFCPNLGIELNNLGWRITDRLLYGVELTSNPGGNNGLVRVGGNCLIESLGAPVDPDGGFEWPADERVDAGEISTDGTTMYFHTGGLTKLYVVDLTPVDSGQPPELIDVLTLNDPDNQLADPDNVHDWAYHPAFIPAAAMLFGGDSSDGEVAVIDLVTRTRVDYPVPGLPAGSSFGGASFNPDGNLVLHRNSGRIYEIDVSSMTIVDERDARGSGFNDATSCRPDAPPCDEAYMMQDVGAKLFRTNTSSASFTQAFELCGAPSWQLSNPTLEPLSFDLEFNNMCFRNQDRLIYALELTPNGNKGLVRFDPESCSVERLNVNGVLPADQRFDAGDCTADGQTMLVNIAGNRNQFYRIDLTSMTSSKVTVRPRTPTSNWVGVVHDWAYNPADGKFYGGDQTEGHLASLELVWNAADGQWIGYRHDRNLLPPGLPSGRGQFKAYGGAWFNADGHLVLHRNDGALFEIDVATRELVDISTGRSSGFNDSASCVGQ